MSLLHVLCSGALRSRWFWRMVMPRLSRACSCVAVMETPEKAVRRAALVAGSLGLAENFLFIRRAIRYDVLGLPTMPYARYFEV